MITRPVEGKRHFPPRQDSGLWGGWYLDFHCLALQPGVSPSGKPHVLHTGPGPYLERLGESSLVTSDHKWFPDCLTKAKKKPQRDEVWQRFHRSTCKTPDAEKEGESCKLEMQRGKEVSSDSSLWSTRGKSGRLMLQHKKAKQQQQKPRGSTCRAVETSLLRKHRSHVIERRAASPSASFGSRSHGLCLPPSLHYGHVGRSNTDRSLQPLRGGLSRSRVVQNFNLSINPPP